MIGQLVWLCGRIRIITIKIIGLIDLRLELRILKSPLLIIMKINVRKSLSVPL
jgi:hypothetical protein